MTNSHFPSSAASEGADIVLRLREKRGVLDNRWPGPTALEIEAANEIEQLRSDMEKLADPVAVHINMLRGGIAKPTWANIKHLYPEKFPDDAQREPVSAEKMLDLLQCSTCFRGDVCRIMPCACAQSLADAAQPPAAPVETKSAIDMIAACYEGLCPDGSSALDFEWARQRGYILPNNGSGKLSPAQCSADSGGLIERLRKVANWTEADFDVAARDLLEDAADEIERLRAVPQGAGK